MELKMNDRFSGGGRSLESTEYGHSNNKDVILNSLKKLSSVHDGVVVTLS